MRSRRQSSQPQLSSPSINVKCNADRYGSPGSVVKEYNKFAEWYLRNFTGEYLKLPLVTDASPSLSLHSLITCIFTVDPALRLVLKYLDMYSQQQYVAPRVLQQSLNYLNQASVFHIISPVPVHLIISPVLAPYYLSCTRTVSSPLYSFTISSV